MAARATSTPGEDAVRDFVEEVLRTGIMLADLLGALLDDLPEDAFDGEAPAEVLVEMLTGSVRPTVAAVGIPSVKQATALLGAMADRALSDLRTACDRAKRQ